MFDRALKSCIKSQKVFAKPASTAAYFRNVNGRRCTICDSPNHLMYFLFKLENYVVLSI